MHRQPRPRFCVLAALAAVPFLAGCGSPRLTIDRDLHINTMDAPDGKPLRVDIVIVNPADLKAKKEDINRDLAAGSSITSADWFRRKPTRTSARNKDDREHYQLPFDQIISFTDESPNDIYGNKKGGKILGRAHDPVSLPEVELPSVGGDAMIYVFGRFTDEKDNVLPVRPAMLRGSSSGRHLRVYVRGQEIVVARDEQKE